MEFNFFNWLRSGVKKSVLLGVSDAVEEIGLASSDDEAFQKKIREAVSEEGKKAGAKRQKRLGRSLKDLNREQT
ncbi:hypothetical protein OAG51_01005 [Pirellulaceae bacterium]|jgi:hypothetical protein|nr:hypothetical protein [Pirellulaceae bacterium]